MNWVLNEKTRIMLLPLLRAIASKFGNQSEFPLQVAKNLQMPTESIIVGTNRDFEGCGIVRFIQGALGTAPCCGSPEIIVFFCPHLWENGVIVCKVNHPLKQFHNDIEIFVRENSKEIISELKMRWQFQ